MGSKNKDAVLSVLSVEYDFVCYIDVTDNSIELFKAEGVFYDQIKQKSGLISPKEFDSLFKAIIPAEELEEFKRNVDRDTLSAVISCGEIPRVDFKAKVNDDYEHFRASFVFAGDDSNNIIISVRNVEDDYVKRDVDISNLREEMERKHRRDTEIYSIRENQLRLITALSETFETLFYIDLSDDSYVIYGTDEVFMDKVASKIINTNNFFKDNIVNTNQVVYEADRDKLIKFFDRKRLVKELTEKPFVSTEIRIMVGGNPVWYRDKAVMYRDENGRDFIVVGVINLSEERRAELERKEHLELIAQSRALLEEKQKELETALSNEEAAGRAKTTFLFNMSHDIRTPMNAIMGFTDLARESIDDKDMLLNCLDKIKSASNHLLKLINEVLDLSQLRRGEVKISETPEKISSIIKHVNTLLGNSIQDKNLTFVTHCEEIRDDYVWADRLHLDQAILNIISNSVKYTEPGGRISFTVTQLDDTKPGYANYRFVINDSGIGMSKDFVGHMFESFTRAEDVEKRGIEGAGLGMAITKQLIDHMGGYIVVESEPGCGTTTVVEVSFRKREIGPKGNPVNNENSPIDISGKRVLVVEDNELNREIIKCILENNKLMVEEAENGEVAVEMVKKSDSDYYDYILMDIRMPKMNGYEATKAIRAMGPDYDAIPIIAITANAFDEDKNKAFEAGMNAHLAKPIIMPEMLRVLREYAHKE